jgi:hypothetical protein
MCVCVCVCAVGGSWLVWENIQLLLPVIPFWKVLEDTSKSKMSKGITLSMQSKQCEKSIRFLSESGPVHYNYDVQNLQIEDEGVNL